MPEIQISTSAVLLLCVVPLILSAFVVCIFRRRYQDQKNRAVRIEQTTLALAASLIDVAPESLNQEIERGLQPLIYEFSLDRIKLFEFPNGVRQMILAASQTAAGTPVGVGKVDVTPFGAAEEALRSGRPVLVSSIGELGPEYRALRDLAETQRIRSLAAFPLVAGDHVLGILSFATLRRTIVWTPGMKRALQTVASIVGMGLAHRRTDAQRRHVETALQAVYDAAPVGLSQISLQGRMTMVNPTFCRMLGYSAAELSEMTWEQITSPEDREQEAQLLTRVMAGEEPDYQLNKRYIRKNGSVLWVTMKSAIVRDKLGNTMYRISASQDISDRKAAEQILRDSEARLRLAMQAGRMFVFDWELSSDALVRSVECIEMLGIARHQSRETGATFLERVHPEDRQTFAELPRFLRPDNRSYQRTYRVVRPDRTVVWVEERGRGQFDTAGRLTRIVGVAADITARREEELARRDWASRLVELQEQDRARIARELHDDIVQRLVLLAVTLERLKLHVPEQLAAMKEQLSEAWKYLHETATDLQRVSHELHSARLQHLRLPAALQSLCNDLRKQHSINATFDGPPHMPLDESTELTLYRISQEALRNVTKHSRARRVTLELSRDSSGLRLRIFDDGVGFDSGRMIQGKGLGLTSMKERLAVIGGSLSIQSAPGKGTDLEIRIPAQAAAGPS